MESLHTHVVQTDEIAIGKLPPGERFLPATHRPDILRSRRSAVNDPSMSTCTRILDLRVMEAEVLPGLVLSG
jgi:hypothetical protein